MADDGWDINPEAVYRRYTESSGLVDSLNQEIGELSDHFAEVQEAVGTLSVGEEQVAGQALALALVEFGEYMADRLA